MDHASDTLLAESAREKIRALTHSKMREVIHSICSNPVQLAEVVAGGRYLWRTTFLRALRPLPVDETIANAWYEFLSEKAGGIWVAKQFLNTVEISTPDTPEETAKKVDEAWTITSHSSEAARRKYGYPSSDQPIPLHEIRSLVKLTDGENN